MTFAWQSLEPDQFATFVGLLGPKIVRVGDLYWSEVRTCFYRPLDLFQEYAVGSLTPPLLGRLGGFQYAVSPGTPSNSNLNLLLFEDIAAYSVATLDKNRRRQVRLAEKAFEIRQLTDRSVFENEAHPVYVSFHNRTRYQVGEKRRDPKYFKEWANALFGIDGILILGAYHNGKLGGVSVSYRFADTVYYATFFCDDEALEGYVSDLMLHTVREAARAVAGVKRIYAGMVKINVGINDFYTHRGARLVQVPANLEINPVTRLVLSKAMPAQYAQLLGKPQNGAI